MSRVAWDGPQVHWQLARLIAVRSGFRIRRTLDRIRSPRRLLATTLAIGFFLLYLANGFWILSARQPADPERLQLWLSGGMVIYAIYHGLRCAWSHNTSDLELTEAERLWLGGAPIQRSSLASYHVGAMVIPAVLKTLLLAVVLSRDVERMELLLLGVFSSLILLEIVRLITVRWTIGFDSRQLRLFRTAISLVALSIGMQVIAKILASTPSGSPTLLYLLHGFRGLGELASSDVIQWLALPWVPASNLVVADQYHWLTIAQLLASAAVLPLAIWILIRTDARSLQKQHRREQQRLEAGAYQTHQSPAEILDFHSTNILLQGLESRMPVMLQDAMAVLSRQWVSVRRYRGTIAMSFAVPTLLCLSPLATGQITEQWFYVVGGIALCTMLLAPPALRIDFRRDLRRMLLLRSLPVRPLSMVLGQLTLPILITWLFQWLTLGVAAAVTRPGWDQVALWTGLLSSLAVFTFAMENALFLAYPHHERSEGVAMMVRAKLTFLGKGSVIAISLVMLVAWAMLCRGVLPTNIAEVAFVGGAVAVTWCVAAGAIAAATICWQRFDAGLDIPPQ